MPAAARPPLLTAAATATPVVAAVLPLPAAALLVLAPPLEGPLGEGGVERLGDRRLVEAEALGAVGLLARIVLLGYAEALGALGALAGFFVRNGGGEVERVLAGFFGLLLRAVGGGGIALNGRSRGRRFRDRLRCGDVLGSGVRLSRCRRGDRSGCGGILGIGGLRGDRDVVVRVVNLVFGYARS